MIIILIITIHKMGKKGAKGKGKPIVMSQAEFFKAANT